METEKEIEKEIIENVEEDNGLQLDYGDIIQIESPSNSNIHELTAFIEYIDNTQIRLVDINSSNKTYPSNTGRWYFS